MSAAGVSAIIRRSPPAQKPVIVPAFGRLGLLPEVGTSWALTRRLGYQGAFAYYAGGEQLDAHRAKELGLVHEVVPHDELMAAAGVWCDRIAALPPHAMAMAKPLLRAAADASWDHALAMEEFAEPQCFTTERLRGRGAAPQRQSAVTHSAVSASGDACRSVGPR